MADMEMAPGPVRLLPAALLPSHVLGEIEAGLAQLTELVESRAEWRATPPGRHAGRSLRRVQEELQRHAGEPGEACVVTKDALLELGALLGSAGAALGRIGCAAGCFAAAGLEGSLVERLVDLQPAAPA